MAEYARFPSLKDRVVFITGAASGIGADMVAQFAEQGARVGFVDVKDEDGGALVEACAGRGHPKPLYIHCDVTDVPALQAAIAEVAEALGPIGVLVNNAANDDRHKTEDVTPAYWRQRFAVNFDHQFFCIQAVKPIMVAAGGGSIVNIGSSSWMIKEDVFPGYATAKSAVQGLTRTMARELGPHNIRVNSVLPGWCVTPRQLDKWWSEEGERQTLEMQCLKQRIYPREFNRMVLFLAADDSSAITSQSYLVDGGRAGL